jgi:lactoylglutathione lyase
MSEKSFNLGLAHIGVFVKDIAVSKKFYTEILEMDVSYEGQLVEGDDVTKLCFVDKDGLVVELVELPNPPIDLPEGPVHHIAFKVKDIEAARAKLEAKGVVFETKETQYKPELFANGGKWIFFKGPDNENLELNEVL